MSWASGNKTGLVQACTTLLGLKDTLRGTADLNWAENLRMDQWDGLTVAGGRDKQVFSIELQNKNLDGSIPAALGNLDSPLFRTLDLSFNALSGSIPSELGGLEHLQSLGLNGNKLSGSIPADLGNISSLYTLYLNDNNLSGSIPAALSNLDIAHLKLHNNTELGGSLPTEFRNLTALEELSLQNTQVTIPDHQDLQTWLADLTVFTTGSRTRRATIGLATANTSPVGVWTDEDEETLYVSDPVANKVFAYRLPDGQHLPSRDITLAAENAHARGIWGDGTMLWVSDSDKAPHGLFDAVQPWTMGTPGESASSDETVYAYTLASGSRDADKDITLDRGFSTGRARDLWGDGTTLWVHDWWGKSVNAYTLADGSFDRDKRFSTHTGFSRVSRLPKSGLMMAGAFAWVASTSHPRLFAFNRADGSYDPNTYQVLDPENSSPQGLWQVGSTLYVADAADGVVYVYDPPEDDDATLKQLGLTEVGGSPIALDPPFLPATTTYTALVEDPDVTRVTLLAEANDDKATLHLPPDADTDTEGVQVDLIGATTRIEVEVEGQYGTLNSYTITVTKTAVPTVGVCATTLHIGLWTDGTTMYVAEDTAAEDMIRAYSLEDPLNLFAPDPDKNISLGSGGTPRGLWSDGTTIWTVDMSLPRPFKLWAYNLQSGNADRTKTLGLDAENAHPAALDSDGETLWVGDWKDRKVYAYEQPANPQTGPLRRKSALDLDVSGTYHHLTRPGSMGGMWTDGRTMWVMYLSDPNVDAYDLETKARVPAADIVLHSTNTGPTSIVSDGTTMWMVDYWNCALHAYELPPVPARQSEPKDDGSVGGRSIGDDGRGGRRDSGSKDDGSVGGRSGGGGGGGRGSDPEPDPDPVGVLENPGAASFQSGIGIISGWVCDAGMVEITLGDLPPQPAAYGTERLDTLEACGDTDNGFGLPFNWNLLGDGDHEVVVLVDDVELGRATVTVTTLGQEFLRDVTGMCVATDFPLAGETATLVWQQSKQNFVLADGDPPTGVNRVGSTDVGYLENPGPNSFQSGIGVLSGWVCDAEMVEIAIGDFAPQRVAYGTERLDTQDVCGDTDNGFGLLFNWNLLGDGEHAVIASVDGEEFGRATVRVTTLGVEFLRGVAGECVVDDFPSPGETVTLEWQETSQNFVITDLE